MEIEVIDINEIVPYKNNPRINDQAVSDVLRSIKEFGFQQPLVLDSNYEVVVGHTRLKAAKALGLLEVPCVIAKNLTDAQSRAYRIMDNKSGESADWNYELLNIEISDLLGEDYDLDLTGFDERELADLGILGDFEEEGLIDPDYVPELIKEAKTKKGDIWVLGNHRLICGDATLLRDIEKLMDGELADQLITDPPYNVDYVGKTKDRMKIENDNMNDENFRLFLKDSFISADLVMKEGAVFYIWHADTESYAFRGAVKDAGWKVRQCLIWNKNSMVMGRQDYHWKHEPCLYGWKDGSAHLWASDRTQVTVLDFNRPNRNDVHPTMKPVDLLEYQITNNTKGSDIVLDIFGGSGSTLIASEKTNRHCRMIELDESYCDVIVRRWQEFTGRDAILKDTSQTFNEIQIK